MFQPRLGIAYDLKGDGRQVVRANAGLYYARIPGLNLASSRSTDGSRGQTPLPQQLRSPPSWGRRRPTASCFPRRAGGPFQPGVFVFDKDFQNPRTFTATVGYERELIARPSSLAQLHPRADRPPDPVRQRQRCGLRQPLVDRPCLGATASVLPTSSWSRARRSRATTASRSSSSEWRVAHLQFQLNYTLAVR